MNFTFKFNWSIYSRAFLVCKPDYLIREVCEQVIWMTAIEYSSNIQESQTPSYHTALLGFYQIFVSRRCARPLGNFQSVHHDRIRHSDVCVLKWAPISKSIRVSFDKLAENSIWHRHNWMLHPLRITGVLIKRLAPAAQYISAICHLERNNSRLVYSSQCTKDLSQLRMITDEYLFRGSV